MNISSLIVTYNRLDKLKKTVEATLALPFKYVVIVDNASTDGTSEWLKNNSNERLIVLASNFNSGGAGGFKHGSEWIIKNLETDWILFYDDDAYPEYGFYEKVKQKNIDKNKVYACKVVDQSGERCGMNIPWKKYPNGFFSHLRYQLNPTDFISNGLDNEKIISLSFVGMLISFNNLKNYHSYIDEHLFIYFDDVYFSYFLYLNKIPMEFISETEIIHDIKSGDKYIPCWKVYYLVRNMLLSRYKFEKDKPFSNTYMLLRLVKYFMLSIRHPQRALYLKKIAQGFYDGIYNNRTRER